MPECRGGRNFYELCNMKHLLLPLLLVSNLMVFSGEYRLNSNVNKAYDCVLSLRLNEAAGILSSEKKAGTGNLFIPYLEHYSDFLKTIISEEADIYETFKTSASERLSQLENGNKSSPWYQYGIAQHYLQLGFAKLRFGHSSSAALDINKAYRLLVRNHEMFPAFAPNRTALGLMQVLIGSVPDNYRWVARLFAFEGTIEGGIANMQRVMQDEALKSEFPFLKAETIFLLTFTTFNLSPGPGQSAFAEMLLNDSNNTGLITGNPLLTYSKAVFLMHQGKSSQAAELLTAAKFGANHFPFHYLDYLNGIARLNALDYGASLYFLKYVNHFRGKSFIKSAYQRLAWAELLKGNEKGYYAYMQRVKLLGNTTLDGDAQALKEAESAAMPHVQLLQARLLFDGGYYARAHEVLQSVSPASLPDERSRLEYQYRKARNHHEWGKTRQAIEEYKNVIAEGRNQRYYFAANAALQLGLIYEKQNKPEEAILYYKECLSMDYDEYRSSISMKAKAGLNRLRKSP